MTIELLLVPEKMANALDLEIERTRKEIAALQNRIREMAIRRDADRAKAGDVKKNRRIAEIDEQIANARELLKKSPSTAKTLQAKIDTLQTERYRLLLVLED